MDSLRAEQAKFKGDRGKVLDEMKRLQEGVSRKVKDAQANKGKIGFKSISEVDERIRWVDTLTSSRLLVESRRGSHAAL